MRKVLLATIVLVLGLKAYSVLGFTPEEVTVGIDANTALSNLANVAVNTSLLPGTANSIDFGSYTFPWKDIYASGTIYGGTVTFSGSGTTTFSGGVQATLLNITSSTATSTFANGIQLSGGCFRLADGTCAGAGGANTALSNLASVAINTSLLSDANNTDDLGAYGFAWRDIYASGTLRVGNTGSLATSTFADALSVGTTTFNVIPGIGRVGIGTAKPGSPLQIGDGSDVSSGGDPSHQLYINYDGNAFLTTRNSTDNVELTVGIRAGVATVGTLTNNNLSFPINGSEALALSATALIPGVTNTLDLGAFTRAYKSIYASGTLRVGNTILSGDTLQFSTGTIAFGATSTITASPTLDVAANSAFNFGLTGPLDDESAVSLTLLRLYNGPVGSITGERFSVDANGNTAASGSLYIASGAVGTVRSRMRGGLSIGTNGMTLPAMLTVGAGSDNLTAANPNGSIAVNINGTADFVARDSTDNT